MTGIHNQVKPAISHKYAALPKIDVGKATGEVYKFIVREPEQKILEC